MHFGDSARPVVGRQPEQATLRAWLTGIRASRASMSPLALVSGEAGIGKSALVEATASEWAADGGWVIGGGGITIPGMPGLQAPYGVLAEAVRGVASLPQVPVALAETAHRWLTSATPAAGRLDPTIWRQELLLDLVQSLSARRPLLLVVEDLHWADPASLSSLVFLARHLLGSRVGLLVTSRTAPDQFGVVTEPRGSNDPPLAADGHVTASADPLSDARTAATSRSEEAPLPTSRAPFTYVLEHLSRLPRTVTLELGPLTSTSIEQLVRGLDMADPAHLQQIVALSEGNPLAAVELAGLPFDRDSTPLPRSVAAAVREHWDHLTTEARQWLGASAVIGVDVPVEVLSRVLRDAWPDRDWVRHREAALATGLIAVTTDGYRFRHVLDQQAVSARLLPEERTHLHECAAEALSVTVGHQPLEVATAAAAAAHWALTGRRDELVRATLVVGLAAADVGAFTEGFSHLERGLTSWVGLGRDPNLLPCELRHLLETVRECARSAGASQAAVAVLRHLLPHLCGDDRALAWSHIGYLNLDAGNLAASDSGYAAGLRAALSDAVSGRIEAERANAALQRGSLPDADALSTRALTFLGAEDSSSRCLALLVRAAVHGEAADAVASLAAFEEAELVADGLASQRWQWTVLTNGAHLFAALGLMPDALRYASEIVDRARRTGVLRAENVQRALANAAGILTVVGRWDDTVALVDDLWGDEVAEGAAGTRLLAEKATVLLLRGQWETAAPLVEHAAAAQNWPQQAVEARLAIAVLRLGTGHPQEALDALRSAARSSALASTLASALGGEAVPVALLPVLVDAVRVACALVDVPQTNVGAVEALRALETALRMIKHGHGSSGNAAVTGLVRLGLAEAARTRGQDRACDWRDAAAECEQALRVYDVAYCRLREGQAHGVAGDLRAAVGPLRAALVTAESLRAWPMRDVVLTVARKYRLELDEAGHASKRGRRGGGLPVPPRAATLGLTNRECDVLQLIQQGSTNRQIARELSISERTVAVHVSNLLPKLGVSSRTAAAVAVHARSLLEF